MSTSDKILEGVQILANGPNDGPNGELSTVLVHILTINDSGNGVQKLNDKGIHEVGKGSWKKR